jgi:hypothetical protein
MKIYLRIALLVSLTGMPLAFGNTTEFRTPQRLTRGEMHWPLKPVEKTWWYDVMDTTQEREETNWSINTWAGLYSINAGEAFFNGKKGGITTETAPLSTLWFGTNSFRGEQVFVPGSLTPAALLKINPFLGFARISPQFNYSENGVVLGLQTMRTFGCDDEWHTGIRLSLPVKRIEIEQEANVAVEETLQDVVRQIPFNVDADGEPNDVDFAYRLDFLSSLVYFMGNNQPNQPYVVYGDGTGDIPGTTTIANQQMVGFPDNGIGGCIGINCFPGAYAVRANANSDNVNSCCCPSAALVGIMPEPPFYKTDAQLTTFVRADGSGGNNNDAVYFKLSGQNYSAGLGLDRDAQGSLFVVPRAIVTNQPNPGDIELTQNSQTIYNDVSSLLNVIDPLETASFFFASQGIDLFAHEHIVGVGDLDLEWYIGYGNRYNWYIDGIIGARFPTGTSNCDAKKIFHRPTGNNKHYEIKLGLEGGYNWCELVALRAEAFYGHAFKGLESRAAVFKDPADVVDTAANCCNNNEQQDDPCALFLRNIGTPICVDVSWDSFYGRFDVTVFHPYNPELGLTFGYEFYFKSCDNLHGDCDNNCAPATVQVADLNGTSGTVDFAAMERGSKVFSNKLYAEIFHRWNFFELFVGASQIVAGENVMKESEAHLGVRLYF